MHWLVIALVAAASPPEVNLIDAGTPPATKRQQLPAATRTSKPFLYLVARGGRRAISLGAPDGPVPTVWYLPEPVSEESLAAAVDAAVKLASGGKTVVVLADGEVMLGTVKLLFRMLQGRGLDDIRFSLVPADAGAGLP